MAIEQSTRGDALLWGAAIGTYGIGDTATTHSIIENDRTIELNPILGAVAERYGTVGMVAYKASILSALFGVYLLAPAGIRSVIPATTAAVGGASTILNYRALSTVG